TSAHAPHRPPRRVARREPPPSRCGVAVACGEGRSGGSPVPRTTTRGGRSCREAGPGSGFSGAARRKGTRGRRRREDPLHLSPGDGGAASGPVVGVAFVGAGPSGI